MSNFICSYAQLSEGGLPFLEEYSTFKNAAIPTEAIPAPNIKKLLTEDAVSATDKSISPRFADAYPVSFSLNNSGVWTNLANGDKIWRLRISIKKANSIGLNFNQFNLPDGAKLFVYDQSKDQIRGAYTSKNNKTNGRFAINPLVGKSCIIEYYEPANVAGQGEIQISSIARGYTKPSFLYKDFGSSGSCNVDVNCGVADNWQDEKKGVAMILLDNGTRWCTGSLINNTAQDCRPLFLSAFHCLTADVSDWIFMFNYESPYCNGPDGTTNQTVQGCTLLSSDEDSDFALLELTENPSDSYDVYFNGWDRNLALTDASSCIHHPDGDVKKISFDYDSLSHRNNDPNDFYWAVTDWNIGTTEGGSSGSPLFDFNTQRIIGQLLGGNAACSNNESVGSDFYGKLGISWDQNTSSDSTNLMTWLDPLGNNTQFLDGSATPCLSNLTNNVSLLQIEDPSGKYCEIETITPSILIKNNGSVTLNSLIITYAMQGQPFTTFQWTGIILTGETQTITLDIIALPEGENNFIVNLLSPNGAVDQNITDNMKVSAFENADFSVDCYCTPSASTVDEWIQSISIGDFTNNSGNNGGYGNYSVIPLTLAQGQSYSTTLEPGYSVLVFPEYWKIWIDFNTDGVYTESEVVFDSQLTFFGTITGNLIIPVNAPAVTTFMRVSMQYNQAASSCPIGQFGEVEDYAVTIEQNNPVGIKMNVDVLLQGALINSPDPALMTDNLRIKNLIPNTSPYSTLPGFSHTENEILDTDLLLPTNGAAVVDWVLLEIRSSIDSTVIIESQSVLVRRDGRCMDKNGNLTIEFPNLPYNDYYVAIRHRNHLGIMTALPMVFNANTKILDFKSPSMAVFGEHARAQHLTGEMTLWGGNAINNGTIIFQGNNNDVNESFFDVISYSGNTDFIANFLLDGYYTTDLNMDGQVIYQGSGNEPNTIFFNILSFPANTNLLTNFIIEEQLPK